MISYPEKNARERFPVSVRLAHGAHCDVLNMELAFLRMGTAVFLRSGNKRIRRFISSAGSPLFTVSSARAAESRSLCHCGRISDRTILPNTPQMTFRLLCGNLTDVLP